MKRMTTEDFIKKAKQKHGKKYDYSKVRYVNTYTKVVIICPTHGEFLQAPTNHIHKNSKSGCPKCGTQEMANKQRKDTQSFVKEATLIHEGFYTYEHVNYKTARKPVIITCPIHGEFQQLPTNHLKGVGCSSCHGGMYNPSKETILYYLSVNNGEAYKIGITCKSIDTRFLPIDKLKIEVLKTWKFSTGTEAYKAEQYILDKYKEHKYQGKPLLASGNTELLSHNASTEEIESILKDL